MKLTSIVALVLISAGTAFADGPFTCSGQWSVSAHRVTIAAGSAVNDVPGNITIQWAKDGHIFTGNNGSLVVKSYSPAPGATYESAMMQFTAMDTQTGETLPATMTLMGLVTVSSENAKVFASNTPYVDIRVGEYGTPNYRFARANGSGSAQFTCFDTPPASYGGYLDNINCNGLSGWAWDSRRPVSPITIGIYFDNAPNASYFLLANQFRQDLVDAGIGDGRHGFSIALPGPIRDGRPHTINARIESTQGDLYWSPRTVTCP